VLRQRKQAAWVHRNSPSSATSESDQRLKREGFLRVSSSHRSEADCETLAHAASPTTYQNGGQTRPIHAFSRQNLLNPLTRDAGLALINWSIMNLVGMRRPDKPSHYASRDSRVASGRGVAQIKYQTIAERNGAHSLIESVNGCEIA
jgi:hypothetical protein